MNSPLRILMVLHMPWTRNLGGAKVQLELAEEFQALGHQVEKFDFHDAFPYYKHSRLAELTRPHFSVKAKAFVKANAHHFDIIDAHQGNLPFTKQELGFKGLLVTRSVGLFAFHDEFRKQEQAKRSPRTIKTYLGNMLRSWKYEREKYLYPQSFKTCDLINVLNRDELAYVRDVMGFGEKCRFFPNGISQKSQMAFAQAIKPAKIRLAHQQVAFIGRWSPPKGSEDWTEIIQRVKAEVPEVRFLFLGTGASTKKVLSDLNLSNSDWIQVVPQYDYEELPRLLSQATIGAFPSHIEGFGLAVLEKFASGLPTVAYDIPGPREMLRHLNRSFLTPRGDIPKFSQQLISLLKLKVDEYAQLSQKCLRVASKFCWSDIAKDTLDSYYQCLEEQK